MKHTFVGIMLSLSFAFTVVAAFASATAMAEQIAPDYRPGSFQAKFLDQNSEAPSATAVPEQTISLLKTELASLMNAQVGESIPLPSFSLGLSKRAQFQFRRVEIYKPDTNMAVVGIQGTTYLKPTNRVFFLAVDGDASAGFSLDRETGFLRGMLIEGQETLEFSSSKTKGAKHELVLTRLKSTHKDAAFNCEIDQQAQRAFDGIRAPVLPFGSLNATAKGTLLYETTIAVDTDNEFITNKFSNNTVDAQTWIEDLFLNLNTIFERDLNMRVLIGQTFLRTAPDPYGDNDGLVEFGLYWQQNLTAIDRDFAMLLSNKNVGTNSFSGVAWVEAYCVNTEVFPGSGFGSFSFNRLGTSPLISPAFASGGIGHEIGHNLGSFHTHCEMLAAGGTDWVDHCYNESTGNPQMPDPACYQGPPECTGDGVGSLMSYCHAPPDGFDGTGIEIGPPAAPSCDNSDVMDPLIIGKLSGLVAANNPSCIADFGSSPIIIFESSFEDGE